MKSDSVKFVRRLSPSLGPSFCLSGAPHWPAETGEFGGELKAKRVVAITTEQYQTPARRPRNSVLSNAKIQAAFGIALPDWRAQLRLAMQDAIR